MLDNFVRGQYVRVKGHGDAIAKIIMKESSRSRQRNRLMLEVIGVQWLNTVSIFPISRSDLFYSTNLITLSEDEEAMVILSQQGE